MNYECPSEAQHYVVGVNQGPGPQWKQRHATRAAAERWLAEYPVSQAYKDDHYRIVSVEEYHALLSHEYHKIHDI